MAKYKRSRTIKMYPANKKARKAGNRPILMTIKKPKTRFKSKTFKSGRKLRNKIPRSMNLLSKKLNGFQISRFLARSYHVEDNNTVFNDGKSGYITAMYFQGIPDFYVPLTTEITNGEGPGMVQNWRWNIFVPQWPGSKLTAYTNTPVGTSTGELAGDQQFGLMPNNNTDTTFNSNLAYNAMCVQNTKNLNTKVLVVPVNPQLHNKIMVHNTYIKMDFQNCSNVFSAEVHVFHVLFREDVIGNINGVGCQQIYLIQDLIKNFYENADQEVRACQAEVFVDQIRKGKLPKKMFKVLKHKVLKMGPILIGNEYGVTSPSQGDPNPFSKHRSAATYKTKFGLKIWNRTACTDQLEPFSDQPLEQDKFKTVHIISIPLSVLGEYNTKTRQLSTDAKNIIAVTQRIEKINIWETRSN